MYTQLEAQPPREQKGTQKTNSWTRACPASAQRPVPLEPRRVRHGKSRPWLSLGWAPAWGNPLCKREASVTTDSCCVRSHSSTPKGPETRSTVAAASTTEAQVVSKQPPTREARASWRWQMPGWSGKQTRTRRGEDYPTQTKKTVLFTVIRKKTQYLRPHRIKSATDSTTNTIKASLSPSREGARSASWPGEGLHPRPAPLHPSGTHLSWGPPLGPVLLEGPDLKGLLLYRTRRTRDRDMRCWRQRARVCRGGAGGSTQRDPGAWPLCQCPSAWGGHKWACPRKLRPASRAEEIAKGRERSQEQAALNEKL